MRISKKAFLGTSLFLVSASVVALSAHAATNGSLLIFGDNTPHAKHFAAVMPTETTQGIREYWSDCVGGAPVFEQPAYPTADATLTQDQINSILANQNDERIIPTLSRIQNAVSKDVDGTSAYDLTFVRDAYAYNYLDSTTKALVTGANAANINAAYDTFFDTFTVVYDAAKDSNPILDQAGVSIEKGYDSNYGDVLEITTELGNAGGTSQLYFYGLATNGVTYGENDVLNFGVYSPFAAAANTSQTYWVGNYGTAKKVNANAQAWTFISSTGTGLNSDGKVATSLKEAISLQRYINGTVDPYTGTYKMTSVVAEKELTEEGSVLLRGNGNITNVDTWAGKCTTDITYNVDTVYGKATQVDIKSKTGVLELEWKNLSVSKLANFDYARLYIYAKTTQRVFVSLSDWRNNIVNIPGVAPFAEDNGTQGNNVQGLANVVADQWNIIDIPTSYLSQDPDGKFFIEVWADQNVAADGWLISDLVGHNDDAVLDNGGQLIAHNTSATVTPVTDTDLGACSQVKLNGASGFVKQNRTTNISGFTSIEYKLKNTASTQMKVLLYWIGQGVYGEKGTGSNYITTLVDANTTVTVTVNVADYFGTTASSSLIMFQVNGAANNIMLISSIVGK